MHNVLDLGRLLGRREAFTVVAARCSAADAEIMQQIRDNKLYEGHCDSWEAFCADYLHLSKTSANRVIQLLKDFGPQYFEVAQLTRISPETYRTIQPLIAGGVLTSNGEEIALIPENSAKVGAAIARLRNATLPKPPEDPVGKLRDRCDKLIERFRRLDETEAHRQEMRRVLCEFVLRLDRLAGEMADRG